MVNKEIIKQIIFENNSSPLHSLEWNLTKEQHGQQFIYFFHKTNELSAAFPIIIKKKGPFKIGWVPYGIPYKGNGEVILKELKRTMRSNGIFALVTIGYNFLNSNSLEKMFFKLPFVKRKLSTFTLDLKDLNEEVLLGKFSSTTRKHVKRAVQEGFKIEPMSNEDYLKFYTLYQNLCEKQGFSPVCSSDFLESLVKMSQSSQSSNFKVIGLKAVKDGVHFGYLIGLINGRNLLEFLRADDTSIETKGYERKLLTYGLISSAIQNKVEIYDFGGVILKEEGQGIYNFKKGFGGKLEHSSRYKVTFCV